MENPILQITDGSTWKSENRFGFLTPTASPVIEGLSSRLVYGAVRDSFGRAVIRSLNLSESGVVTVSDSISLDRRGSSEFDTDGTILGHVSLVNQKLCMFYIGFRQSNKVKFQAFSGLAESEDGKVFHFRRRIFNEVPFSFLEKGAPDIVACHWNNLNKDGDGLALLAIGNDWLISNNNTFPKYSTYLIEAKSFEFARLIAKVPQSSTLYRLGRPRLLNIGNSQVIIATGGKADGDYRPYFFELKNQTISELGEVSFPVSPGADPRCQSQVSYPEILRFRNGVNLALFNGDKMGIEGCLAINVDLWFETLENFLRYR